MDGLLCKPRATRGDIIFNGGKQMITAIKNYFLTLVALTIIFCSNLVGAQTVPTVEMEKLFEGLDGCFILYDITAKKSVLEYNPGDACNRRIPCNSTFKIPLSLMAFESGLITPQTVFKWNGVSDERIPDWNQDQSPATWQKYSVVWVSQQLTPRLGLAKIENYLSDFAYGNQNFSGDPGKDNGLTNAWLSSSLKISAREQIAFLTRMETGKLSVSPQAVAETKKTIYMGKLNNGADYWGKTGSGWQGRSEKGENQGKLRDGWWVGIAEHADNKYVFAVRVSDRDTVLVSPEKWGGQIARGIALQLLNAYFTGVPVQ